MGPFIHMQVGSYGDNQDVAESLGFLEIPNVPDMEKVKNAVAEDDTAPFRPVPVQLACELDDRLHDSPNVRSPTPKNASQRSVQSIISHLRIAAKSALPAKESVGCIAIPRERGYHS